MPENCTGVLHTVKQGENLCSIAQIYGASLSKIIDANPNIEDFNNLKENQEICIPTDTIGSMPAQTRESLVYLFGGTTGEYLNAISITKNSIKTICTDSFEVSEDGNLIIAPEFKLNERFIESVHEMNIKITPFLTNNWDRASGFAALDNRENLSNQLLQAVQDYNLDGVNIDIENVTEKYRAQYVDFIRMLREKLPENKTISVAVVANPSGWTTGWHGSYDYKTLSEYSDYLLVMAYDESYQGSEEGPVSSSSFFKRSIEYALNEGVPKDKIVAGIPFFGRYWKEGQGVGGLGIADIDVENLLANYTSNSTFDEATKSAFANVIITPQEPEPEIFGSRKLTAGIYNIWYDNQESTRYKLETINDYDLKGVGAWALGQEIPEIWDFYTDVLNGIKKETSQEQSQGDSDMTKQETLDFIYPVGSIYMSVNSTDPGVLFGGSWQRWGNGRTIVSVNENDFQNSLNSAENTGGAKEHRHNFRLGMHWWYGAAAGENAPNGTGAYKYSNGQYDGWNKELQNRAMAVNNANYNTPSATITSPAGKISEGDTETAHNWPPYITCYIWKRTA